MRGFVIIASTLPLTVSACRSDVQPAGSSDTVPILAAYRDNQCLIEKAKIERIRDKAALSDWWQAIARLQLPVKPLPQSLAGIDFANSAVFVVFMGSRPTAGFGIDLYSDRAPVAPASLTIPASWQEPPPDAMVAQVVTSPCVVLVVPADHYETVSVRDQQGTKLLEARF